MRVLVTGGHGYIGGRLIQALARDRNFAVTAAGRSEAPQAAGVHAASVDWESKGSIEQICRNQDAIVHLAAMNEADCERDPEGALRFNGFGTLNLLRTAEAAGVRRFIYLSTAKVFGANPAGTIDEVAAPRPTNHYGISHRVAEDYVLAEGGKGNIEGVVLRLSNAVGAPARPGVNAWMLIANDFCRQAVTTGRIVLRSSGMAWRNFTAMADVVGALRHALGMSKVSAADGLFHVGGPQSLRICDLAALIAKRAESVVGPVKIERPASAPGEHHPPLDWRSDKLAATGWARRHNIEGEIDATLDFCRVAFCPA